jgi:hypothetical protein
MTEQLYDRLIASHAALSQHITQPNALVSSANRHVTHHAVLVKRCFSFSVLVQATEALSAAAAAAAQTLPGGYEKRVHDTYSSSSNGSSSQTSV